MSGAFDPTLLRPDAPAMPIQRQEHKEPSGATLTIFAQPGLTARQYAAIALCVPDSGTPWLDAMIERRLLNDFAAQAMARITAADVNGVMGPDITASASFNLARCMLAASK